MNYNQLLNPYGYSDVALLIFIIWSTYWKGWALWRASKNDQKYWFIALLIVNTVGISEIIYLLVFQKKDGKKVKFSLPDIKALRKRK